MLQLATEKLRWLSSVSLRSGSHKSVDDGVCAMECVAYIAGEPHSDHPACVCPVISSFMRSWNDALPDGDRDRLLKPLLPLVIGTVDPALVEARGLMVADWLVRVWVPDWLDALHERYAVHTAALRAAPAIKSWADLAALTPVLVDLRKQAAAAWAAAWAAALDSARDSALAAALDSALDSALSAWAAAWAAARAAAWDVAWASISDKFGPTNLQDSAAALVRRLCAVTE